MQMVSGMALFQLRCAARAWLDDHADSPNAPAVIAALRETAPPPLPPLPEFMREGAPEPDAPRGGGAR